MYKIGYKGKSNPNVNRIDNEDAFIVQTIWDDKHVLSVVIDGVGDYDGNEKATEIAKETIVAYLEKHPNGRCLDLLKEAVVEANNNIVEERNANEQFSEVSCRLLACLVEVEEKQINMVHVGDIRLYQFYRHKLKKLSHDLPFIDYCKEQEEREEQEEQKEQEKQEEQEEREEMGDLFEEQEMNHPQPNFINRLVGGEMHHVDDPGFLETDVFTLLPNTTLLLCSDRLSDTLISAEIESVLQQNILLIKKADSLIQSANNMGEKDNIAVVLIEYISDEIIETIEESDDEEILDNTRKQQSIPIPIPIPISNIINSGVIKIILYILSALLLGFAGGWYAHKRYM